MNYKVYKCDRCGHISMVQFPECPKCHGRGLRERDDPQVKAELREMQTVEWFKLLLLVAFTALVILAMLFFAS